MPTDSYSPESTPTREITDTPTPTAGTANPAQAPIERYVRHVYRDLLDRNPSPANLATWANALESGTPRVALATAITASTEYRTRQIDAAYRRYLNRKPDSAELHSALDSMRNGRTIFQVDSGLLASRVFYAKAGSSAAPWVTKLYATVLGRTPDTNEGVMWAWFLHHGGRRAEVAQGFVVSNENITNLADDYYQRLLGRGLYPADQAAWIDLIQAGGRDDTIIRAIVASDEYWGDPGGLDHLVLTPESATITSGRSQAYTAQGFDSFNHALGDVTSTTTFTVDPGSAACVEATCSLATAGSHTVTGTNGDASGTAIVHVTAVNRSAYAWGDNEESRPTNPTKPAKPRRVGTDTNWTTIALGFDQTVAIKTDGTLWAWGLNSAGQLGDGTTIDRAAPVQVGTDNHWISTTTGGEHAVAIKTDGTLWAWGLNANGQLGDGTTTNRSTPMQVGTDNHWASTAVGSSHTLAIKTDGTLWAWGWNSAGQLGNGTTTSQPTPRRVGTDTHWASVVASARHTVAIKTDGTLWTWGWNPLVRGTTASSSKPSRPEQVGTDTHWTAVTTGASHTVAIKTDGTLWAWGWNAYGQLGDGTTRDHAAPMQVGTDTHWTTVAAGEGHTVAVKTDGTLWAWGSNAYGQLGTGTVIDRPKPTRVGIGAHWAAISANGYGTAALHS